MLGGRYRLVSLLGEGGMGAVWRAHQIQLDAAVAIKVLHAQTAQQPGAITRFRREAKAAAGLRSPHVVQIVDHGVDEATGTAFIVMELLEGESLEQRLARQRKLSPQETARWIAHAARALARAHAVGVVHRDLKPANIFIVENADDELAKVLDFGIAKVVGPEEVGTATATATGALLGTPHYMSAEQIDPGRSVDYRTDLWSLAVIACECMTGRRPFEGDTLASLAMRISLSRAARPSSLGPVPRGFDAWFARCTDLDPAQRFASALELSAALREVVDAGDLVTTEAAEAPTAATLQQERPASVGGVASHAVVKEEAPGRRLGAGGLRALLAGAAAVAAVVLWKGAPSSAPVATLSGVTSPSAVSSVLPSPALDPRLELPDAGAAPAPLRAPAPGEVGSRLPAREIASHSAAASAPPAPLPIPPVRTKAVVTRGGERSARPATPRDARPTAPAIVAPAKASSAKASTAKSSPAKASTPNLTPPADPYDLL